MDDEVGEEADDNGVFVDWANNDSGVSAKEAIRMRGCVMMK